MKQTQFRTRWQRTFYTVGVALAFTLAANHVQGASFELIYNGSFNNQDALNPASQSAPSYFTGATPFTIRAFFDTASPNLAPASPPAPLPFAGFRAYSPSLLTIDVENQTDTFDTFTTNPAAGATVAIFDLKSFTPGRYAVGILQQPPQDGAGIIGDFSGASPDFTANALVATTFTGYNGVGYSSGVCLQGTGGNASRTRLLRLCFMATGTRRGRLR